MQPHPTGTGHGFLHVPRCHRDGDAHGDSALQSPLCKDCPQCPVWGRQGLGHPPPPLISPVPQFGNIKGITRAILDEFPALDNQRKKAVLLGALCTSFYLLGLPLVTQVWHPLHPWGDARVEVGEWPPLPISAQALRWEDRGLFIGPGINAVHGKGCPAPTPLP